MQLILSNGSVVLNLQWDTGTDDLVQTMVDFLSPWFISAVPQKSADLTLRLKHPDNFSAEWRSACIKPFSLRKSSAPVFSLDVMRGMATDGRSLAWDELRQVGYAINTMESIVDFYGSSNTAFIHLIELVRYYALLAEQAKGTVILHSAAVRRRDDKTVIGIVGAKGAGKTTTMLSMLASGDYVYFSGDKLLLDQHDGMLRVRGWPDYPHIGIGTLRNHVELAQQLGVSFLGENGVPLLDSHKILLEPSRFFTAIEKPTQSEGVLEQLVLPCIHTYSATLETEIPLYEKQTITLNGLFEWPHQFITSTWHGLPLSNRVYTDQVEKSLMHMLQRLPWRYRFGIQKTTF